MASDQPVARLLVHPHASLVMQDRRSSSPRAPWVRHVHGPALIQPLRICFEFKKESNALFLLL